MIASCRREKLFSPIFTKAVVKCWFPCLIAAASAHNLNTNVWFADSSLSAAPFNCTFLPLAALRRSVLKAAIGNIHLNVYFFKNSKEYLNLLASLSAQFSKLPPSARLCYQLCHVLAACLCVVPCPNRTDRGMNNQAVETHLRKGEFSFFMVERQFYPCCEGISLPPCFNFL